MRYNVKCRKRINESRAFVGEIPQRLLLCQEEVQMCQEDRRVPAVIPAVQT
jgi:hypothetical protein